MKVLAAKVRLVIVRFLQQYEATKLNLTEKQQNQNRSVIRENREGAAMKAAFWITLAIYRLPTTIFASMDEPEKIIHIQLLSAR